MWPGESINRNRFLYVWDASVGELQENASFYQPVVVNVVKKAIKVLAFGLGCWLFLYLKIICLRILAL